MQASSGSVELGDLRLGQVVIKRVAVVKHGVNNGSGDGGSGFGVEVWTDTAKLTKMVTLCYCSKFLDKSKRYYSCLQRELCGHTESLRDIYRVGQKSTATDS